MSVNDETHAAIVAEMKDAQKVYARYRCGGADCDVIDALATLKSYADRLEAAHRRELSKMRPKTRGDFGQFGNVAALREALEKAEAVIDGVRMMVLQGQEYDLDLVDFGGALAKCRAALAATETKREKQ